jgi:urease accessory protein
VSVPAAAAASQAGWRASLRLALRAREGRTVLAQRSHEGPLVVQRPFYPEGPVCHLYLVHPPGGVAGGDHLWLQLEAGADTHAVVTTPAATKIYRSTGERVARMEQHLQVQDAALEWLPQETIVFSGACARLATKVQLAAGARFIGWEILCLGRPANAEVFETGAVRQDFELWLEDRPLVIDRLRLHGGDPALTAAWGLHGAPVLGTLLAFPANAALLQVARTSAALAETAATLMDGVLLVRLRADNGEAVRQEFERIWRALRPAITGREPHAPRIWAT